VDRRSALAAGAALLVGPSLAQARTRRIGVLLFGEPEPWLAQLRAAMADLGYREGRDVVFEVRAARGRLEHLRALAVELVQLDVDVIVANATPSIDAAARATSRIPVVMATAGDALRTGIVASLARPGGNLTGLSLSLIDLAGKTVAMLHEALPGARRVACIVHRDDPLHAGFLAEAAASAQRTGLSFVPATLDGDAMLGPTFAALARDGVHGTIVQPIFILADHQRERIVGLQLEHRLPTIAGLRRFADAGGFMAYASEFPDLQKRAAGYVDRLLRGARAAELPIEQPSRFDLVVNLRTASALGIAVAPDLLARADQVLR
jgi:putative ABC transport system substrate-binding protein